MIAIPLPFVASLLLVILATVLFYRQNKPTTAVFIFIILCALTATVVGLRWTTNIAFFKALQPLLASLIPILAWYCFAKGHQWKTLYFLHAIPPVIVLIGSLTYPFWQFPIDPLLSAIYVSYGIILIRSSLNLNGIPEQVRLSEINNTQHAERYAGIILIVLATIDGVIGIDFALYKGIHAPNIIAIGYFIILPLLSITVVIASLNMVAVNNEEETTQQDKTVISNDTAHKKGELKKQSAPLIVNPTSTLTEAQITEIVNKVDHLITTKEVFLDPDLTLDRLARKVGIPARQISLSINHVYGRNISQVINEYRIERAKQLLINTDKSITHIYFDSGFQTKSNFNREFARLTEQTPSAFRRFHLQQKT